MDFTEATILITGGNSDSGRGLAEALSTLIITARSARSLQETLDANPGMSGYQLDVPDSREIEARATPQRTAAQIGNLKSVFNLINQAA